MGKDLLTLFLIVNITLGLGLYLEAIFPIGDWRWLVWAGVAAVAYRLLHARTVFPKGFREEWAKQRAEDRNITRMFFRTLEGRVLLVRCLLKILLIFLCAAIFTICFNYLDNFKFPDFSQ